MMFNGAQKYGPKQFDRVMEAHGGSNNAYTSENVTVYTDWFPANKLEIMFELEADRIGHLTLDDKMVESERGVVLSERITGMENNHWEFLEEQVRGAAFLAHPYRWSVIGYESDIKNWQKADLQKYFETYYAPNNGVVVLVGAVNLDEVRQLAQKYFGPIPAQKPPRPVHTQEPPQLGEKRVAVSKDVATPYLMIVYHVPETKSEDFYTLELLNSILSSGRTSRLYRALVDEKLLATEITTNYPLAFDPTLFYVYALCNQGISESQLEQAIYEELNKIIQTGVTEAELQKVKNHKLVGFYRSLETINGKANTIGTYELFFGDYQKFFTAAEDYQKVTLSDIQRVAAKYFKKSNRTVGILKKSEDGTL
jgi:predicted Zn-dependent peptidase